MAKKNDGDSKAKIIDAAYKVLAEQGYDKASMKIIAKEAGVAQGLINYYFPSKEDLLFELFRMESKRYCDDMEKIAEIPISAKFIREALNIPRELVVQHPEWHRLRFELFAIGLRSESGCKEIAESLKVGREQGMRSLHRLPLDSSLNPLALSSILVAVLDGLALQQLADPDFDSDVVYGTLAAMLEAFLYKK